MEQVAIIIPCYNRVQTTVSCLHRLRELSLPEFFHIYLVDDGSTDGTVAAVRTQFPEVRLIEGEGDLYWTGAIELGMRAAFEAGACCFIWLNDDAFVEEGAIQRVARRADELGGIASGLGYLVVQKPNHFYTYHFDLLYKGWKALKTVPPDLSRGEIRVDTCRGNLVAVSRKVVDGIGFPDGRRIPHFGGDTDYGLRATSAGFSVVVIPAALVREVKFAQGESQSWLLGTASARDLCRSCLRKRHPFYPPALLAYSLRHWGFIGLNVFLFKFTKLTAICLVKLLVPRRLLIFLFGRFSYSWKAVGEG